MGGKSPSGVQMWSSKSSVSTREHLQKAAEVSCQAEHCRGNPKVLAAFIEREPWSKIQGKPNISLQAWDLTHSEPSSPHRPSENIPRCSRRRARPPLPFLAMSISFRKPTADEIRDMPREVALNIWLCGVIYSEKSDLNVEER